MADGSATAADDYTAAPVGFGVADTTTQTVTVSVAADAKVELDEAFDLVLSSLASSGLRRDVRRRGDHRECHGRCVQRRQRDRVDLRVGGRRDRRDPIMCSASTCPTGGRGGRRGHGRRVGTAEDDYTGVAADRDAVGGRIRRRACD